LIIITALSVMGCTKEKSIDSPKIRSSKKITFDNTEEGEIEDDDGDNGKMIVKYLPDPVQQAIKTSYPSGKIEEASMEKENSTTVYIIELADQGSEYTLDVTPEGEIVEITEEIEIANLPETILSPLKKAFPGSVIQEAEKVKEKEIELFEVIIITGKNKIEVTLDTAGKILSQSKYNEDNDTENHNDESKGEDDEE